MAARVLIPLGDGFEEIEAVVPIDLLRRAGLQVLTASVTSRREVTGSHDITLLADVLLEGVMHETFDLVLLPGGPGVASLRRNEALLRVVRAQAERQGRLAAICAAPLILADLGLLGHAQMTSFPACEAELRSKVGAYLAERVVLDGPFVTSRGAGTAEEFSLALIAWLLGPEAAEAVRRSVVARP